VKPGPDDIHVWWVTLDHSPDFMDDVERARFDRLRVSGDQRRFMVGCALLRLTVGSTLGIDPREVVLDRTCPRCGGGHGKPRIVNDVGLEASVSHSGGMVVVVVTRNGAVGVDLEQVDATLDHDELANEVLASGEAATDVKTFLAYWTCKESILKATGDGLQVPLTALTVRDPSTSPTLVCWSGRHDMVGRLRLHRLNLGAEYVGALTVLDPSRGTVHVHDGTPMLRLASSSSVDV
jgi:4'-phosphopantetheinyl transferase